MYGWPKILSFETIPSPSSRTEPNNTLFRTPCLSTEVGYIIYLLAHLRFGPPDETVIFSLGWVLALRALAIAVLLRFRFGFVCSSDRSRHAWRTAPAHRRISDTPMTAYDAANGGVAILASSGEPVRVCLCRCLRYDAAPRSAMLGNSTVPAP